MGGLCTWQQRGNKMVLMMVRVQETLAAGMGLCSWLQEGQTVAEAGDWESAHKKYHY